MAIEREHMKEKTHFKAQQQPSAESDNQTPSQAQPLKLKNPHHSEDSDREHRDDRKSQSLSVSKSCVCNKEEMALQEEKPFALEVSSGSGKAEESGRERLKRHRVEVAGRVWIPEIWGQEELLKDWIDCSAFDAPLVPHRIMTARAALVQEGTRANAGGFRIQNRC